MHLAVMVGKFVRQVVREWCPSATGPLLPAVTEWAGYLVPGDVILSRAPNGVSNEHSRSDRSNLGPNCSLDTGGTRKQPAGELWDTLALPYHATLKKLQRA